MEPGTAGEDGALKRGADGAVKAAGSIKRAKTDETTPTAESAGHAE